MIRPSIEGRFFISLCNRKLSTKRVKQRQRRAILESDIRKRTVYVKFESQNSVAKKGYL